MHNYFLDWVTDPPPEAVVLLSSLRFPDTNAVISHSIVVVLVSMVVTNSSA